MHILIIGAAGMVGAKLVKRLLKDGAIAGKPITAMTLVDVVAPSKPEGAGFPIDDGGGRPDRRRASPSASSAERPDYIFHLAAIVSGEAEADFDKGYRVNLDGTRYLFEAIRKVGDGYKPRVVFTSSIAVFGAPFPDAISDEFFETPLTSYGTQKAIDELLLSDYTRRGFMDGIGIRLPTICVRPGKPNMAASGFFSNIIREPLAGQEAVLPVPESVRHWHASPRSAVNFLLHAAGLDGANVGARRNLTMPGLSVTVGEQIEALRKVAGDKVVERIRREPDPTIMRSSRAGRAISRPSARRRSASAPRRASRTSSASTSRTSSAGSGCSRAGPMRLVSFAPEHFPTLAGWFSSELEVVQWGGWMLRYPLDEAQLHQMLELGRTDPPERLCWMAEAEGTLLGHAQLAFDWRNGNARVGRVVIAPAARGSGQAKPLLRLMMAEAFGHSEIARLELYVLAFNARAIRIYEELGFILDGNARSSVRVGAERFDQLTMSMLRHEYGLAR